jgi:hypothetical protein
MADSKLPETGSGSKTPRASCTPSRTREQSRGRSLARRGSNEIVIHERVIQSAAGSVGQATYPTLTDTNYIEWLWS